MHLPEPTFIRTLTLAQKGQRPHDEFAAQLLTTCLSRSLSNPKKRPSASNAEHHPDESHDALSLSELDNDAQSHPQKRSRATDWPLRASDEYSVRSIASRPNRSRTRKALPAPAQRHDQAIEPRPSRFHEGSMNDRVSAKPPSIYIHDEAAMEQYHQPTSSRALTSFELMDPDDDKTYCDAGIEPVKPSGMYRFGKALVSAFNPNNVWQGIHGIWKGKEEPNLPQKSLLHARKARAERAYAEMKQNGFYGTQPFSSLGANLVHPELSGSSSQPDTVDSSLRGSDETTNRPRVSTSFKRGQPTPAGSADLLIPPIVTVYRHPPCSPVTQAKSGPKTSIDLRRPSFQSLKKVKSHIQLPSAKRKLAEALPSPRSGAVPTQSDAQYLKKQPSRKDVAKQRKLSKQVSDLEGKLEVARRELHLCTSDIPDVPKIPALGQKLLQSRTLPSPTSRSHIKPADTSAQDESDPDWHPPSSRKRRTERSTPKKPASRNLTTKTPSRVEQRKPEAQSPVIPSSGKKRKSSGGRTSDCSYNGDVQADHDSDPDSSRSPTKISQPRKAQKFGGSSAPPSGATSERSSAELLKGFHGVPAKKQTAVPPVPTPAASFDPAKVDKEKLLAMRSIPKDDLPFGSHLDDIVNLQKEFPNCRQKDLDQYLSSLTQHHKAKLRLGNSGNAKPATPFSAQSNSISPVKALRENDVAPDACQTGKNCSPNRRMARELSTIQESVTVDPSGDKSIPPMPTGLMKRVQQTSGSNGPKGKHLDKPLPNIQKENYDWPEDVF
ncbi:MAG: hypothetical protein Q9185_005969 [Variospora sp. 1 TL-2023]